MNILHNQYWVAYGDAGQQSSCVNIGCPPSKVNGTIYRSYIVLSADCVYVLLAIDCINYIISSSFCSWLMSLDNTKWLHHIAGLMRAALVVVNAVDIEKRPVLVHCSDGWDRTPQIVALAEIMLDPYYRTKRVIIKMHTL